MTEHQFQACLNEVPKKSNDVQALEAIIKTEFTDDTWVRVQGEKFTYNLPCAFDIETTSFIDDNGHKAATMYIWQFGLNGHVFYGRTWEEFIQFLRTLRDLLDLNENNILTIYVHNLGFEFQFMRKWLEPWEVFAMESRKPLWAECYGLLFKCSFLLSGYSLAKVGEHLHTYKVKKLVGDLDYKKIRNNKTVLTQDELNYCFNDVRVVMSYIQECIDEEGSITHIPLTKTGYVRRYCRDRCYAKGTKGKKNYAHLRYRSMMHRLTLEPEEYLQLKRAFQGGFTHASPFYSGKVMEDITSYDFTSSYPTVMIAEKFPMHKSELIPDDKLTKEVFEESLKCYCCLFDVTFINLKPRTLIDSYISISRCISSRKAVLNNGRVVSADEITLTITEQDYYIIDAMYEWDDCIISQFRRYMKDYLPKSFVQAILDLYKAKTTLKGIEGSEAEYLSSKEKLNSCYGMAVTDIVRDEIKYINEWLDPIPPDLDETIDKYNKGKRRFLFYPWGVWVTAYARRNLFAGILEFDTDYIYSDTDSVKVKNAEKHKEFIDNYNNIIVQALKKACKYHGIDPEAIEPKTIKGIKKPLGVWDFDGHYKRFKTLGAKRYIVEYDDGHYSLTVSGLNKKTAIPYLEKYAKSKDNALTPIDIFTDNLYVPKGYTGGNIHTYIDTEIKTQLTDYNGVTADIYEKSCIHLDEDEYTLTIGRDYVNFLLSL